MSHCDVAKTTEIIIINRRKNLGKCCQIISMNHHLLLIIYYSIVYFSLLTKSEMWSVIQASGNVPSDERQQDSGG